MLRVQKKDADGTSMVQLQGVIDEQAALASLVGPTQKTIDFYLEGITHINSNGIKLLLRYFRDLQASGSSIRLHRCAPSLVEQINLVPALGAGIEICSVCLPYFCEGCSKDLFVVADVRDLKATSPKPPKLPVVICETCRKPAIFDDLEQDYFVFLNRI